MLLLFVIFNKKIWQLTIAESLNDGLRFGKIV